MELYLHFPNKPSWRGAQSKAQGNAYLCLYTPGKVKKISRRYQWIVCFPGDMQPGFLLCPYLLHPCLAWFVSCTRVVISSEGTSCFSLTFTTERGSCSTLPRTIHIAAQVSFVARIPVVLLQYLTYSGVLLHGVNVKRVYFNRRTSREKTTWEI